jgi:putative SOS response-associated peptidase YedK
VCGRFVRNSSVSEIASRFDADTEFDPGESYNITPGGDIAVVVNQGHNKLVRCRWGFIPHWATDPSLAHKMINARAETVGKKSSFRDAFKHERCLVVADGFYEWKKEGRDRIPYYIRMKSDGSFGFAGLYSLWTSPEGDNICTTTIITSEANDLLRSVHERMPVIIHRDDETLWLDPHLKDSEKLLPMLRPYESKEMMYYEVSRAVNKPDVDSPENIEPLENEQLFGV